MSCSHGLTAANHRKGAIVMRKYLSILLIVAAVITLSTSVWAAKLPKVPGELINKIPNHLVSKNIEMVFTTRGGWIYDKTRGGNWISFPTDIFYLRKNCDISENLVLLYGYTKAYVYDLSLGRWYPAPESFSYHDSDLSIGIAGRATANYAIAIGVEKTQIYDYTLHKWFVIHGISYATDADKHWTTFPTSAGLPLHRVKKANDALNLSYMQCCYKVGSGTWVEDPMVRMYKRAKCQDIRIDQPDIHMLKCNDNTSIPWKPTNPTDY